MITYLTEQNEKGGEAVKEILFANYPLFDALRKVTKNKYRLYFANFHELEEWLGSARGFEREEFMEDENFFAWYRSNHSQGMRQSQTLYIRKALFGKDGALLAFNGASWDEDWVRLERVETKIPSDPNDDIPF